MATQAVSETDRRPALTGHHTLSIRLQPDGLSFACREEKGDGTRKGHIPSPGTSIPEGINPLAAFGRDDFSAVCICIPTREGLLAPAGIERPESHRKLLESTIGPLGPDRRILCSTVGEITVLFTVSEKELSWLPFRFGGVVSYFHPFTVSLSEPESDGITLHIDRWGHSAFYTLRTREKILFCDVFPASDPAAVLYQVNRIGLAHGTDAPRILCSGEDCEECVKELSRYYRYVTVHPDGPDRDLLFPLR